MMVDKKLMFREGERFLSLNDQNSKRGPVPFVLILGPIALVSVIRISNFSLRIYVFFLLISSAMVLISRRLVCMALHPYQSV
jgi:hypothetical protein